MEKSNGQEIINRMLEVSGAKNDTALAAILDVAKNTLSTWKTTRTVPSAKLIAFSMKYDVDLNWLRTGEGEAKSHDEVAIFPIAAEKNDEHSIRINQLAINAAAAHTGIANADYPDVIRSIFLSKIGLYEIVGKKSADGIYLITVPTDSMAPTINKGDIVFVDTKINSYISEGVYVFDLNGETYIKRLQRIPTGVIRALSDNKLYPPFDITEKLFNTAVIRGKFIRVLPINPKDL